MMHLPLSAPVKIALIFCAALVTMLIIAALSDRPLRISMGSDKGIDFGQRVVGSGVEPDRDRGEGTVPHAARTPMRVENSRVGQVAKPGRAPRQNSRVTP